MSKCDFMTDVWAIGIAYDYGMVESAGYFDSEERAKRWIERRLADEDAFRHRYLESLSEAERAEYDEDQDSSYEKYYVFKLMPWHRAERRYE